MSSWNFDEADNRLTSWSSVTQFDDMVWDDFGGTDDHIVPEPNQGSQAAWVTIGDRRRKLHRENLQPSGKNSGLAAQGSGALIRVAKGENFEARCKAMPLPTGQGMWDNLETGADSPVNQETSFGHASLGTGREGLVVREEVKVEPTELGSGDLGAYMRDSMYPNDDASIITTSCQFSLGEGDPEEDAIPLFGNEGDVSKLDYSWDNDFGNLDDVDKLFRTDSSIGEVMTSGSDVLQWPDSSSPPGLQSGNPIPRIRSPSRLDRSTVAKSKLEALDMKMEFVPIDSPLPLPCLEKSQNLSFKDQGYSHPINDFGNRLQQPGLLPQQQQRLQQSTPLFEKKVGLHEEKAALPSGQMVEGHVTSMIGMETTEDDSGISSVTLCDSDKASMAQAHRARRHAANRKRSEERSKRQPCQRKFSHVVPYGGSQFPPHLQPVPLHLSAQANHLQQSPLPSLHGYIATPQTLSTTMQPMVRPPPSYMQAGYVPPMRLLPAMASTSVATQMPQRPQAMFMGYQQQCSFSQPMPLPQQLQFRPPLDFAIHPPASGPSMTPQEKLEKLRWRQQMQAQLAVEQQHQQLASQGVASMDPHVLQTTHQQPPQGLAVSQADATGAACELAKVSSDADLEPSLSVGQTSAEAASAEEEGSLEGVGLHQLESAMSRLEMGTRLCIRDALYRLARSAMKRRATGGDAISSQTSGETENTSDGLDSPTSSDPSSSSRVSRAVDMSMMETQTNPIDRSIAHLLFHKRSQQPTQGPYYVPLTDGTLLSGPSQATPHDPWMWHSAGNNWVGAAPTDLSGVSPPGMVVAVDTGLVSLPGVNMQHLPMMYNAQLAAGPTSSQQGRLVLEPEGNQAFDQQTNKLPSLLTATQLSGAHFQESSMALGGMMSTDASLATGSQLGGSATVRLQTSIPLVMNEGRDTRKEPRSRRLERAAGGRELSQIVESMGLEGSSLQPSGGKEEAVLSQSGSPHSASTVPGGLQTVSLLTKSINQAEIMPRSGAENRGLLLSGVQKGAMEKSLQQQDVAM